MTAPRRILFVTPPYHCGVVEVAGSWPPLGLMYLAAQARDAGWEAEIYDAMTLRHDFDDIRRRLSSSKWDVLATTAITPSFPAAQSLCRLAKEIWPDGITLMGGVHPSFCAEPILQDPDSGIDYILRGEGERCLKHFLQHFEDPVERHQCPGLSYAESGSVRSNPRLPLMEDLDELEVAWDLVDWKDYEYFVLPGSTLGAVSTSRGCDHECVFCSQQRFWEKKWRGRSPRKVVEEMRRIHDQHGIDVILLTDEYPTHDADRWAEILERIIGESMDIHILIETRVEDILRDTEILPRYRKAGIVHIYVGAEATDQETLDLLKKDIRVEQSREAIRLIAEYDMISETSFVLGFPEETKASIERTLQLAREFNPDFAHFLAITPWPYADLYKDVKDSIEVYDLEKYNLIEPIIRPHGMTLREIDLAIIDCYRRFYMPKMIQFNKIQSDFRRQYLLRSMKMIMQSSFLIGKFAKLGLNPKTMMKDVLRGGL